MGQTGLFYDLIPLSHPENQRILAFVIISVIKDHDRTTQGRVYLYCGSKGGVQHGGAAWPQHLEQDVGQTHFLLSNRNKERKVKVSGNTNTQSPL